MKLLIYGVTGFTGKLVLEQALEKGLKPLIAGRNPEKTKALAEKYDCNWIHFEAHEAETAIGKLEGVKIILNCAGPFVKTYKPIAEACLKYHIHYLDITGEMAVLEGLQKLGKNAQERNVILMPAVGFDVVPTDCMALRISKLIAQPTHLELGFGGMGSASRGTMKTAVFHAKDGNKVRKNGKIVSVPYSKNYVEKKVNNRKVKLVSIPWGDVFTAYHTTQIPNIVVRTAMPGKTIKYLPLFNVFKFLTGIGFIRKMIENYIDKKLPEGPDAEIRKSGKVYVFGDVKNEKGDVQSLIWETPEAYYLTAVCAVEIADKILNGNYPGGFHTPAGLLGYQWFLDLTGVKEISN